MTAADLVGEDQEAGAADYHSASETNDQSDKMGESRCIAGFDVRKFTSAVSRAKSDAEIANIIKTLYGGLPGMANPAKTSMADDAGIDVAKSCQSMPEPGSAALDSSGSSVGNTMLMAGTKSYSWSSSLPNGSRLEMLASSNAADEQPERSCTPSTADAGSVCDSNANTDDVVAKTVTDDASALQREEAEEPTSVLPASHDDAVTSMTFHNSTRTAGDGTVSDGDSASCVAVGTKRKSVSTKLRVGDFNPVPSDVSETTFSSPRMSLDQRLRKPRHLNECTQDMSQFDMSASIMSSSQPARASASRNFLSSPATPTAKDSNSGIFSSLVRNPPSSNSQVGLPASSSCQSLPDDTRSFAGVDALRLTGSCSFDLTMSTRSVVDSVSCLSFGLLEDTTTNLLPQLPVTYHKITGASNNDGKMSFAGRIHPTEMSSGMSSPLS